ncbi:MAG: hypothetical protein ABII64_07080 [Elusimicrobiota bacterium]
MRKLLALVLVVAMASTTFAYLPISRWNNWRGIGAFGQMNLGSFQRAATQGMFYSELDVVTADPVELLDFEGNNLYTAWSNARNWNNGTFTNGATPNAPALTWGNSAGALSDYLLLGVVGNPLGGFGIEGSRAGIVYQNCGAKAAFEELDQNMGGAAGFEDQFTTESTQNIEDNVVVDSIEVDRQRNMKADMKGYTWTRNTQWNVGVAKNDMFINGLALGFGLAHQGDAIVYTGGGSKSYTQTYLTDLGATTGGMNAGNRLGDNYSATYLDETTDLNSNWATDVTMQGRYGVLDNLTVQGTFGARFATTINPGGLLDASFTAQGSLRKNGVQIDAIDDTNIGGTQYFNTGTSLINQSQLTKAAGPTLGNFTANGIWDHAAGNAAVTDFSDKRTGMGPMIEAQGTYTGVEKVDVTGIFHYDTVKQPIDASQTNELSTVKRIVNPAAVAETGIWSNNYVETIKTEGENTTTNLNVGTKIEFKAMEALKLALGGFIYTNTKIDDFSKVSVTKQRTVIYSDGNAADVPGTVNLANIPGPVGATFGTDTGFGEGTWQDTDTDELCGKTKVEEVIYSIPVGIEIPCVADKLIFRAGTNYLITKTKTTTNSESKVSTQSTAATPQGGTTLTTTSFLTTTGVTSERITYAETNENLYTYGIQWNVNQNLTLACNALLDNMANSAVTAGGTPRSSLLDIDAYRNIQLQAVLHF